MNGPTDWPAPLAIAWIGAVWMAVGVGTGWVGHHLPAWFVGRDTWLTRLRPFESGGRVYERRVRIPLWKDRLPEAGALFRGGFSKRAVADRTTPHLVRFVAETRRAEYVHWMNIAAAPLFWLFLPAWTTVAMAAFALVVHLPFVAIQRYNRARLLRTLGRRGVGVDGTPPRREATPAPG